MCYPPFHATRTYPEINFSTRTLNSENLFGNLNILNVLVKSNFTRTSNLTRTLDPENCYLPNSFSNITPQALCRSGILGEPEPCLKNWKPENLVVSPGIRARESPGVVRFGSAWGLGCRPLNDPRVGNLECSRFRSNRQVSARYSYSCPFSAILVRLQVTVLSIPLQ